MRSAIATGTSRRRAAVVSAALAALALTAPSAARAQSLGTVDFPNSGRAEAQEPFVRGVLLLHSFEYEDAAEAFREARRIDPGMVMAYWGEAMTYNHPVWMQQDRQAALEVLGVLAATPEARALKAGTPRERAWIEAVDVLYGPGEKQDRDFLYRDAMRRMWLAHPDDDEVATFYALSILGTAHEGRDFATYMRAAAVAQPVFLRSPDHPGAAHYVIHAFDDPVHAPLGLPAARAYARIAPDAGHAQHMTSHIFVAMGLWDDVVGANVRARDVQNRGLASGGGRPNVCGHYTSWLHYGYLQQGRLDEARGTMAACQERMGDAPSMAEASYYVAMRARAVIDVQDWEASNRWSADLTAFPALALRYDFVDALAALRSGDVEAARRIRDRHGTPESVPEPRDRILLASLDGLFAAADGRHEDARTLLEEAARLEESLPYEFGPPATLMPPHELLAEELLRADHPEEALPWWEAQLARTPQRTASLLGLARTTERTGDTATALETWRALATVWKDADPGLPGLAEVMEEVGGARP